MRQLRCHFAIAAGMLLITALLCAQEPRPDTGIIYGRQYVNSYFGFSYQFPTGWSGTAMRLTGASQSYPLFAANAGNGGGGSITIEAEHLWQNGNVKTGKDFLTISAGMLNDPANGVVVLPGGKHYVFGGKEFDRIDLRSTANGVLVRQALVCTVLRDYAVTFQFKSGNESELEELVGTMLALGFLDSGQNSSATTQPAQVAPVKHEAAIPAAATPPATQIPAQHTTTAPPTTQPAVSSNPAQAATTPATTSSTATTGAPSALINMASPPHTLVGDTLPTTTMPQTGPQPLVKVAAKPDMTKTAVIQAVMPAPSAELNTTTVRNVQSNTPTPASKNTEPAETPVQTPVQSAKLTPATTPPLVPINKITTSPGAIAGRTSTEITRVQISAATLESYVIRKVAATYPLTARQGRIEGVVELTILVDEKGEVQDVKANSGPDILARSAEEALRHWRFRPIIVDGKATPIESRVSLNFQLPR